MARRTTKPRGRKRGRPTQSVNGSAAGLLSQVSALVTENLKLARENKELHSVLDTITQSVQRVGSAIGRSSRGIRIQSPITRRTSGRKRTRRRITDPLALERRRAALAKARQVLAAKRAAARKGK
jgi:hypothetical protein